MATIIARDDGRFEIRESISTPRGPRSRTLAIFRELTPEQLDHAAARARRPFDREAVLERARRIGVPSEPRPASAVALDLIGRRHRDEPVARAALALLRDEQIPDSIPPMLDWIGKGPAERGAALRDAMRLADRILRSRG